MLGQAAIIDALGKECSVNFVNYYTENFTHRQKLFHMAQLFDNDTEGYWKNITNRVNNEDLHVTDDEDSYITELVER